MADLSEIPPLPEYPDRIITFIDILGFKSDIQLLEQRPALHFSVEAILRKIAICKRNWDTKRATTEMPFDSRLTHFSDCLVMSYQPTQGALRRALADAAFIGHVILKHGYLPRGVITRGKLIHDDAIVYGAGLIEAYELERDSVVQPRIAIHDKIIDEVRVEIAERGRANELKGCLRDRGSGSFVHIAGDYWPFVKETVTAEDPSGLRELFDEQRDALPLRYARANERVRQKLEWMAAYLNETIDELCLAPELKTQLGRSRRLQLSCVIFGKIKRAFGL
jgi:hypothetical protein